MRSQEAGAMAQTDHMSVHRDRRVLQHFRACAPNEGRGRVLCAEVPYIKSVEVDGGSEFRGEFEEALEEWG